jgi:hypothetical protein
MRCCIVVSILFVCVIGGTGCRRDSDPKGTDRPSNDRLPTDTAQTVLPTADTVRTPPAVSGATGAPTGDTATTALHATAVPTGSTATPPPPTSHTGTTAAHTGWEATGPIDTATPPTAHTVGTAATAAATADTTSHSGTADTGLAAPTADTSACIVDVPLAHTADTGLPSVTDTGTGCQAETADTGEVAGSTESCPEVDWVLYTEGNADQAINHVHSLPDGAVFVIGHDLVGGWSLAEGRPDEVVMPLHCSVDFLPWMAVVETDGTVRWGRRLADTCGTVFAQGSSVSPSGDVLVWGNYLDASYGPTYVTVDPDGPNPVQLPPPCDSCDEDNGWWAQIAPDGTVVQAHSMTFTGYGKYPSEMIITESGHVIARGRLGDGATMNTEDTLSVHIPSPTDSLQNPDYLVGWSPTGEVAWTYVYGHPDFIDPPPERLVPGPDGTFHIFSATIVTPGYPKGWGVCTEFETWYPSSTEYLTMGHAPYDEATGALLGPPESAHSVGWSRVVDTPWGRLGLGRNSGDTVVHGRYYPGGVAQLAYVDDDDIPLPGQVVAESPHHTEPTGSQLVAAGDDFIVVAGRVEDNPGGTFAWTCGPDVPAHGVYLPHNGRPLMYQAFTPELSPTCGDVLGIDNGTGVTTNGMASDGDGGVIIGWSILEEATFMEGTPDEITITPNNSDLILMRLHTP